ncbi:hypothetical protein [Chitinophaga ginsengisoli]|uniref:Uncharacterized protein n=1 Tax=Chitinophaga ginsengisoli TaxID=363837 RepID=A0A2P8G2Y7_9BACT|nr:hypothetical protein [Chitinophaga ginsengisoli]PSL28342.1 hypothetical protein CLV42_108262 [Chitinophaga ginsengisoli]
MASPREFMKSRRPESFSDTTTITKALLNRSLLEYKLDVITNNNQEQSFQTFCCKLAQLEIAPNLRMQTGPTGGGDSKADSETYPVSEFNTLYFWEGLANDKGERWAFAISAKKDWATKVKSDVKGIINTNRDYKRIFFVTNQFARDKRRAQIEDELTREYNVAITILDRTWILDKVFDNKREKLAIDELELGDGLEETVVVGPNDKEREEAFKEINSEIESSLSNGLISVPLVNKALNSALLARGMGKPKVRVNGLFDRAIRLAEKIGSDELIYSVKYNQAWTQFFWFEDYKSFLDLFEELELIAERTINIATLERQHNLTTLFPMAAKLYNVSEAIVEQKERRIQQWLQRFVDDDTKPSASAQAKILLTIHNMFKKLAQEKDIADDLIAIAKILKVSTHLLGFPYDQVIKILLENGDILSDQPEYENLVNDIVELETERKGDLAAAHTLQNFGISHLESERYHKSIEYLGRSLFGLYKQESKKEFIYSLYFIAYAYEAIGLRWAARGSLIHASSYAFSDFKQHQKIDSLQYKCCRRLKWLELLLGRISYALEWHQTDLTILQQLVKTQDEWDSALLDASENFAGVMGCLLLKTAPNELGRLEKLPDVLDRLHLWSAETAILYLLGGDKYLPNDLLQHIGRDSVSMFFNKWLDQPAQQKLPELPEYNLGNDVTITTRVLGTEYIFYADNSSPAVELCETIAGALEAFLATAIQLDAFGKVQTFKINVKEDSTLSETIISEKVNPLENEITIYYRTFNPHQLSVIIQQSINEQVQNIVITIIAETIGFADAQKTFQQLIVKQEVYKRAFNFLSPFVMLGNVLGHNPRSSITQWYEDNDKQYQFDGIVDRVKKYLTPNGSDDSYNSTPELRGHQNIKTLSVINEKLWSGHAWRGFAFSIDPRHVPQIAPTLYLIFDNEQKVKRIFQEWKETFGSKLSDAIRISIIKGIDVNEPFWYKGIISSNIENEKIANNNFVQVMSQVSTMTPKNPMNLEGFLKSLSVFGSFVLAPCCLDVTTNKPVMYDDLGFIMKSLTVRDAWQIGLNDLDMVAISESDNPIIPITEKDPPVIELIKWKKSRQG